MKLLKILYVKTLILLLPFRKINRKTTDEKFRESIMHSGGHYDARDGRQYALYQD